MRTAGFASMGEVVLGISGASGAIYGVRLAQALNDLGIGIRLVVSDSGRITLKHECDTTPEALADETGAILEAQANIGAKSASGSAPIDAVVICPCSGTTLGKLAAGIGDNLIRRSAIVAMKEQRKLIIVPREAPYATVHLENMAKLSGWGTVVIPASPGFYTTIQHPSMTWSISLLRVSLTKLVLSIPSASVGRAKSWTNKTQKANGFK